MTQAIISVLSGNASFCLPINQSNNTTDALKQQIYTLTSIPVNDQVLSTMGGHILQSQESFPSDDILYFNVSGRLLGGKGGFGSMLRAQGGRMNAQKTTNFEACRDLQGRRIRTVNDAKKLQEELDAIPEREAEKREKLKRKIDEALKEREPTKHLFDDNQFLEDKEEVVESVKSAVVDAIKRQKVSHKPSATTSASVFDDDLSSEDDEDDEEEEEEEVKEEEEEEEEEEEVISAKGKGKGKGKARASR
ncbi:telomere stability and silencing-domain-containing protein [Mucor mucedo]|uniref:telomere stability and silencing-domain-containing protein n=1 Tax=Mucor mucedo TaxID=29922 RepID=UPI0022203C89|nr:telomere stability and silencing-domain-containing protein [Mucor mucedo]KAI7897435.1 telomere stability and silencing-domain-containing protein [Mucor mucedo]